MDLELLGLNATVDILRASGVNTADERVLPTIWEVRCASLLPEGRRLDRLDEEPVDPPSMIGVDVLSLGTAGRDEELVPSGIAPEADATRLSGSVCANAERYSTFSACWGT